MKGLYRVSKLRVPALSRSLTSLTSMIIFAFVIILPTLSIAQEQLVANEKNCKDILVKEPSHWDWKLQEKDTRAFLEGDTLSISLVPSLATTTPISSPQTPAALPQARPENGTENAPALKAEDKKAEMEAQMIRVCAYWQNNQESSSKSENARNNPLKLEDGEAASRSQLQIRLDVKVPLGIRTPAEIILSSSNPSWLPNESQRILISSQWLTTIVSSLFVGAIYLCLAIAVHNFYRPSRAKQYRGWKFFDPAVISACDYGAASLANLQILWFSLIVTWILAFGWLVMGKLLNPSMDLLSLLGISGGANVLAKSLTSNKQRLSLESWNWLVDRNYLRKESAIDPINVAKWRDFVVDGGVLDPSRYQLIIFGFMIGVNLLFANVLNLETFKIPAFFLTLQTVSSGLYLFGKSVKPNTKDELEAKVGEMKINYPNPNNPISDPDNNYLARTIESLYGPAAVGAGLRTIPSPTPLPQPLPTPAPTPPPPPPQSPVSPPSGAPPLA
jgi:hypothetical protein